MNVERENFEASTELSELDAQLRRSMPGAAPPDLANRVYRASVADLPTRPVVAHLGWTSWNGWKVAAALGLLMFYAAAWVKPHMNAAEFDGPTLAINERLIAEPDTELDQRINDLETRVANFSVEWPADSPTADTGRARDLGRAS